MKQKLLLLFTAVIFYVGASHAQNKTYDWALYRTMYNVSFYTRWENSSDGTAWFFVKAVNNNQTQDKRAGFAFVWFYDTDHHSTETLRGNSENISTQNEKVLLKVHLQNKNSVHYDFKDLIVY